MEGVAEVGELGPKVGKQREESEKIGEVEQEEK